MFDIVDIKARYLGAVALLSPSTVAARRFLQAYGPMRVRGEYAFEIPVAHGVLDTAERLGMTVRGSLPLAG